MEAYQRQSWVSASKSAFAQSALKYRYSEIRVLRFIPPDELPEAFGTSYWLPVEAAVPPNLAGWRGGAPTAFFSFPVVRSKTVDLRPFRNPRFWRMFA